MSVQPEVIAAQALVDFLRRDLPAKVTAINATRNAVLTSALAGPFVIPTDAVLKLSAVSVEATPDSCPLTAGTRTAAQLAADITTAAPTGLTASADAWDRLVLTATAAPASGAGSAVYVASDADEDGASTGLNAVFGWAAGGEHVLVPVLVAPSWRGVCDGWPMGGINDMGLGFWVVLGDRTTTRHTPNPRNNLYNVAIRAEMWSPFSPNGPPHRSRELVGSALRALHELFESNEGRYLGRQASNDVQMTTLTTTSIPVTPTKDPASGLFFDIAKLLFTVRVFQRPD